MRGMVMTLTGGTYSCSVCGGLGFIIEETDGYQSAKKCRCRIEYEAKKMLERAGFGAEQKNHTLDNFSAKEPEQKVVKELVLQYAKNFKSNSLCLCGRPGTGKTHLGVAVLKEILKANTPVKYVGYRDLIARIKSLSMFEDERQKEMEKFQNAKVLMIDDLFKGFTREGKNIKGITEADKKIIYEIVDDRYKKMKSTIITTELLPVELNSVDEAIASRIAEMSRGYRFIFKNTKNYRYRSGV